MGVGSSSHKRKAAYDPQRKWGLSPAAANGSSGTPSSSSQAEMEGATYVVAGHIVASAAGGKQHDMFLKESLGREAQARAARRANSHDTDVTLKRLLKRDKEGMRAVQEARRFAIETGKKKRPRVADGKPVEKEGGDVGDGESSEMDDEEDDEGTGGALADKPRSTKTTKNAYTARVIKDLGFDPTAKSFRGIHGRHEEQGEKEESLSRNKIYSEVLSVSSSISAHAECLTVFFFFFCTVGS
jgi:minichromosome maintenance protein 10